MGIEEAADRVEAFIEQWTKPTSQYDPAVIYTLGRIEGDYQLLTADLRALVEAARR